MQLTYHRLNLLVNLKLTTIQMLNMKKKMKKILKSSMCWLKVTLSSNVKK